MEIVFNRKDNWAGRKKSEHCLAVVVWLREQNFE
jgi:hypothetical protein